MSKRQTKRSKKDFESKSRRKVEEAIIREEDNFNSNKLRKILKLRFPWWCKLLAYVMALAMIAGSAFFILVKGIEFGDEKVKKWITSLLLSFVMSIFVTQPLKILLVAAIVVLITKKTDDEDEELNDESKSTRKKDKYLNHDEEWLHIYKVCFASIFMVSQIFYFNSIFFFFKFIYILSASFFKRIS